MAGDVSVVDTEVVAVCSLLVLLLPRRLWLCILEGTLQLELLELVTTVLLVGV